MTNNSVRPAIAAAVDFGTYGSGFAYTHLNDPSGEVFVFEEWPSSPATYIKTRSALLLEDEAPLAWGYAARLALERPTSPSSHLRYVTDFKLGLLAQPEAERREAVTYVTHYLRLLRLFALERIRVSFAVDDGAVKWTLTVPAIWSDANRAAMRTAALDAGFHASLALATEPEVAAIFCLQRTTLLNKPPAPGARVLVVDAGGGTVDLTAFEIAKGGRLRQFSAESGDTVGSTFLDAGFREALRTRLSADALLDLNQAEPADAARLADDWERAKRNWDGGPLSFGFSGRMLRLLEKHHADELRLLSSSQDGVDDALVLTANEVKEIFDRVVEPVLELVDEQIAAIAGAAQAYVFLVGGFAQSPYLQARLRSQLAGGPSLIIPPNPASAVLLGAAMYAARPGIVETRKARLTYGVATAMSFDRRLDPLENFFLDWAGKPKCRDRFDIFARLGDNIPPGRLVKHVFLPTAEGQTEVALAIYATEARNPRYVTEDDCVFLAEVVVELGRATSVPMRKRDVELSLTFGDVDIAVTARVKATGETLDTVLRFPW